MVELVNSRVFGQAKKSSLTFLIVSIKIILSITLGVLCVIFVFVNTELPNRKKNGFIRNFSNQITLKQIQTLKLPFNAKKIVGSFNGRVFLSVEYVNSLWSVDKNGHFSEQRIAIPQELVAKTKKIFSSQIFGDTYHVIASNVPYISTVNLNLNTSKSIIMSKPAISRAVYIGDSTYLFRRYEPNINDMLFVSFNSKNESFSFERNISSIRHDGGIITDGQLHFDRTGNRIIYVHYYDNLITTFSKTLDSVCYFRTIDTVSTPNFIGRNRIETPPLPIMQCSTVINGKLLVCSNLKADNESRKNYSQNVPLDIYDINDGKYIGSHYLPLKNRSLPRSIYISDNKLYVLFHDKNFSTYELLGSLITKD